MFDESTLKTARLKDMHVVDFSSLPRHELPQVLKDIVDDIHTLAFALTREQTERKLNQLGAWR